MREITRVILHCSATKDYQLEHKDFDLVDVELIRRWHVDNNGWQDIGYHYLIKRNGATKEGRVLSKAGAHTRSHNANSIGVCWAGTKQPTVMQLQSLCFLYTKLQKKFHIRWNHWYGHYEFNKHKSCPGIYMPLFREYLRLYSTLTT